MVRNGTSRVFGYRVDHVSAAGGTSRELTILKVTRDLALRRRIGSLFVIFQRPLLFGAAYLPQMVDAHVHLGRVARFDEVRDGDRRQHAEHCDSNKAHDAYNN